VDFPAIVRTEIDLPNRAIDPRMEEADRIQSVPKKLPFAIGHHRRPMLEGDTAEVGWKATPANRDAANPKAYKQEGFQVR